jgi:hypothetical protein
MPSDLKIEALR